MRIILLLILLECFSVPIRSQVPRDAVAPEDDAFNTSYASHVIPRVTGKLLNLPTEELNKLTITYTLVTPFSEFQRTKTVLAKPDGSFSLEFDYAFPYQQVWFGVGDFFYASLYANKDLYVELDMKRIMAEKKVDYNGNGVRYLGTDGPMNDYLNNYVLYKREEQIKLSSNISSLMMSSLGAGADIVPAYNKLFDSVQKIEDSYVKAYPSAYRWILQNERMSDYYGRICLNYVGKVMDDSLWQKVKQQKSYLISNNNMDLYNYMVMYINSLPTGIRDSTTWKDVALLPDLDAPEKALIDSLKTGEKIQPKYPYSPENMKKWIKQLKPQVQEIVMMRSLNKRIQRLDSLFSAGKADFLKLRLNVSTDLKEQKTAQEQILLSMHTGWCIDVEKMENKRTEDKIDKINEVLAKPTGGMAPSGFGTPFLETSFGATMYVASDIKALDFLAKLKQSYPNKAIIIDRWATWCAPCLSEMPHAKKLQEESKDLPVIFVYLCTINSSTENKWKTKVAELQQPGIHFLIDEALDADLSNYFSFSGYPGYAFIDKMGKYRPGVFKRISEIENRESLSDLVK
jgi:thiol-disulfide isomerase/thioredoxin